MAKEIPTVKVEFGDHYMVINEADFDASQHKLWVPKKKAKSAPTVAVVDDKGESLPVTSGSVPPAEKLTHGQGTSEPTPPKKKVKRES